MLASYALELHALKTELQSTLARLGVDPINPDDDTAPNIHSATSDAATRRSRRRPTRWNRRQLTQELAAASQRRRELERQLQQDIQRQENDEQQHDEISRHRTAWQAAVTELQQQRAEIMRQIEQDTAADAAINTAQTEEVQETQQRQNQTMGNSEENQYSIGGVVTLEPLSSSQRGQVSTLTSSRSGVSFQPVASVPVSGPAPPPVLDTYPRYRNTPDALNDVFSLQLKFAETMLKLEKSVQVRDQLLHYGASSRRAGTHTREQHGQARRRQLPRRSRSGSGSNSDSSVMYRETRSESFSSSAYSFSSLDSTPHGQTIRVRYPNFGVSRATTAETLAPSSSGAERSPESETTDSAAAATNAPLHESLNDTEDAETTDERQEIHRTPTTGSSVTTPTTGSDQKSNTSSSKQVRFGEDAYSTPVLARRFNFDGPSIDEDDDEEKEEEVESVLSFLGGSSVTSADLNNASFLRAFERFRRELNASRHTTIQSPMQPLLARKLFPAQSEKCSSNVNEADVSEGDLGDSAGSTTAFSELEGLGAEDLQERRRQLCLDIQAESAQLVLNFGTMQSAKTGSNDAELTKNRLLALRDELEAVDARLNIVGVRRTA
ncbi:hypothetical protein PC129_g13667 [Phytophthora cactorum]|uniref:Uncharacterized protein n=1 Tax=Phytophthora cactorum TaxID=29920 RepID=A0A329RUA1_9STRA|nr:hypothetical protein Pcac1_g27117 [Phytophthora cactorum]KAG2811948.1 hypothetical protein PC111_g15020 [Phytophthora cactorum]KAG2902548.1 hypothetical protein PC115_g15561 [Phytophthora cactorum]KAG2971531.1 hypothetical protein PC118_g16228 [Phytophthora cactorum]KAG3029056.1 hypothetical protein PC119_g6770 [Phytophthora cactorum]